MNTTMRFRFVLALLAFALAVVPLHAVLAVEKTHNATGTAYTMSMHHQHLDLNHALGMVVEGSSLMMLGQMEMSKGIDELSVNHGKTMMKNGQSMLNKIMSGEGMIAMHDKGTTSMEDPQMK